MLHETIHLMHHLFHMSIAWILSKPLVALICQPFFFTFLGRIVSYSFVWPPCSLGLALFLSMGLLQQLKEISVRNSFRYRTFNILIWTLTASSWDSGPRQTFSCMFSSFFIFSFTPRTSIIIRGWIQGKSLFLFNTNRFLLAKRTKQEVWYYCGFRRLETWGFCKSMSLSSFPSFLHPLPIFVIVLSH